MKEQKENNKSTLEEITEIEYFELLSIEANDLLNQYQETIKIVDYIEKLKEYDKIIKYFKQTDNNGIENIYFQFYDKNQIGFCKK